MARWMIWMSVAEDMQAGAQSAVATPFLCPAGTSSLCQLPKGLR